MLEHRCGDLLPFSHKSIGEVARLGLARSRRSNSSQMPLNASRKPLNAVALRFPFTGTKGPEPLKKLHSRVRVSSAPESNGGEFYTTPADTAHGDLRLVSGCSAMETHFMKLPTNSYCADVASRSSLELGSECCNRGQTNGPVLWACVAYHFTAELLLLQDISASQ